MDGVVAKAADHEGLAPHLCHAGRPPGLVRAGFPEAGEFADLANQHLARFPAHLAPSFQEPMDQLLPRAGDRLGGVVGEDRVFFPDEGDPAEPGYEVRLLGIAGETRALRRELVGRDQ